MFSLKNSPYGPYTVAILGSVFLSLWRYAQSPILNNDAVVYLQQASLLSAHEWEAAWALYKWPFYAGLIAFIQQISGLSLETAARLLDMGLWTGVTVAFVHCIHTWCPRHAPLWSATVVILGYPWVNEMRPLIIREAGYLAFYLVGIGYLLKSTQRIDLKSEISALLAFLMAGLFRIEGGLGVLLASAWMTRHTPKWRLVMSGFGGVVVVVAAAFWLHETGAGQHWQQGVEGVRALLRFEAKNYSEIAWFTVLLVLLVGSIVTRLTIPYCILTGYAVRHRLIPTSGYPLWVSLLLLQLVVLAGQLAAHGFLTRRYSLAFALTAMLAVPFAVAALKQNRAQHPWRWRMVVAALVVMFLDSLTTTGATQHYRIEAGKWLLTQEIPTLIASPDRPLLWYAQALPDSYELANRWRTWSLQDIDWKLREINDFHGKSWLVLPVNDPRFATALRVNLGDPHQIFQNERRHAIWIYPPTIPQN